MYEYIQQSESKLVSDRIRRIPICGSYSERAFASSDVLRDGIVKKIEMVAENSHTRNLNKDNRTPNCSDRKSDSSAPRRRPDIATTASQGTSSSIEGSSYERVDRTNPHGFPKIAIVDSSTCVAVISRLTSSHPKD
eukprot:160545-Amorphochlora_amoeboformis.AAC.2